MSYSTIVGEGFIKYFDIDRDNETVSFSPKLFQQMAVLEKAVAAKKIRFRYLGVNSAYYRAFKKCISDYTKRCLDELTKLKNKEEFCETCHIGSIDFNTLDFLEGSIKSATDRHLISWEELSFSSIDAFNELLEDIKELLYINTEETLLTNEYKDNCFCNSRLTNLMPGFEIDAKFDGNYNVDDPELYHETESMRHAKQSIKFGHLNCDDSIFDLLIDTYDSPNLLIPIPNFASFMPEELEPIELPSREKLADELVNNELNNRLHKINQLDPETIRSLA